VESPPEKNLDTGLIIHGELGCGRHLLMSIIQVWSLEGKGSPPNTYELSPKTFSLTRRLPYGTWG